MNRIRSLATTSTVALLMVGLAGCSAAVPAPGPTGETSSPLPEVSIENYADVTAQLDFARAAVTLPLDPFDAANPELVMTVLHAVAVRTDECMMAKGFPAIAGDSDWSPYAAEDRTFGLWSVDYASRYGVDLAVEGRPVQFVDTSRYGPDYAEAHLVCMDEAKQSLPLAALDAKAMTGLDVQIRGSAADLARSSDEGTAALGDWQECMQSRGVVLDPDGRPGEQYKAQGREAVIRAIVIEAECAASTGAIQRLYDLQARFEAAYIDAMHQDIAELKREHDEILAELEAAIAGE